MRCGVAKTFQISREANSVAREHFEQAVAIDPEFAAAIVMLGVTYAIEGFLGWSENPGAAFDTAIRLYEGILENDPDHPLALMSLASLHGGRGNNYLALARGARAVALDPNDSIVRGFYGRSLTLDGQFEAGVHELEQSIRLSPISPDWVWLYLGEAYFVAGETQLARTTYEQVLAKGPSSLFNEGWARSPLGPRSRVPRRGRRGGNRSGEGPGRGGRMDHFPLREYKTFSRHRDHSAARGNLAASGHAGMTFVCILGKR